MSSVREAFARRPRALVAPDPQTSANERGMPIALGTMNFGKRTPEGEAKKIVARAYERGIRIIDTANVYESGVSEKIVGRAIAERRGDWIVATKVGLDRKGRGPEGLAPDVVRTACEQSLARLGIDAVDVYYLHAPDPKTDIAATLDAMRALQAEGKIRELGVSNFASWQILEMVHLAGGGAPRPIVAQQMYNPLVRQLEIEYFRFAERYDVHTTTYNALAGGLLARDDIALEHVPPGSRFDKNTMYQRRYWSRAFFEALDRYRALAREAGLTLAGLSYGWLAARPGVDSVLVGPATVAQLDFAVDAIAKPLDGDLCAKMDDIARELAGTDARYAR